LAKKNPGVCTPGSLPSKLLSLDLLRPFGLEKAEWFRTDSGTSYRLSKSKTSLSSRKANEQPDEYKEPTHLCQPSFDNFHKNPQPAKRRLCHARVLADERVGGHRKDRRLLILEGAKLGTIQATINKTPSATTTMVKPDKLTAQLLNDILTAIRHGRLLQPGDGVGVCVSGGADSVAMLHLLLELREKLGVVLSVVHFNHHLRGKASDADEKFVKKLAVKHGLPFHVGRDNVAAKARREKANLEDAARRARYAFFARLEQEGKLTRIAVGHTADDQAETVLAHILRGTGLAGLGGIHPASERVVRPLLQVRRAVLRVYLKKRKQTWREDATNRDTSKMRARIRKTLLPLLEKQFQPSVVEHLASLAETAREDEAFLDVIAAESEAAIVEKNSRARSVKVEALLGLRADRDHGPIRSRIIRRIVQDVKPRGGQLNADHVRAILDLAEHGENGKFLPLPGGVEVRREHNNLIFLTTSSALSKKNRPNGPKEFAHNIEFARGEFLIEVPCLACVFRFTRIDWPAKRGETSITGPVLDRRALCLPLVLRSWRPGDQFRPSGHRKAHKLKRLLNEKRVSRWEREGWPVLTSAGVLAWARGFPVAAEFAANERTRVGVLIAVEEIPEVSPISGARCEAADGS
jgi:tRNA(Ile)-lysidine synthase